MHTGDREGRLPGKAAVKSRLMYLAGQAQHLQKEGKFYEAYNRLLKCRKTLLRNMDQFESQESHGLLALIEQSKKKCQDAMRSGTF